MTGAAGKERVNSGNNDANTERAGVRATVRMWKGGPLRQMAATKVGAFIPFAKTINGCSFAGRYVCDECQQPSTGVSLQNDGKISGKRHFKWLCDLCTRGQERKTPTPEQKQAVIDRLAAARQARTAPRYRPAVQGSVRIQERKMSEICNAVAAVAAEVNPLKEVYAVM